MYNIYNPTRTSPGKNAPRNISPALVEETPKSPGILNSPENNLYSDCLIVLATSEALASWSANIIKTIEGGIIWPKVPAEHTIPLARDLS